VHVTDDDVEQPEHGTEVLDVSEPVAEERATRRRRLRLPRVRLGGVGTGVWIGLLILAGGFGLLAITWSQVAALTDVAAQLPYLVSGGLVGIGLILLGLLIVNLSVKRKEALDRRRQLEEVRDALISLRSAIDPDSTDDKP
jgi:hypothetical protein